MTRESLFSYQCAQCGKCCFHKRIQVGPYEVLRIARNRSLSTRDCIRTYMEKNGPYLRIAENGACIFLHESGCLIHPDRPLACRTYPLGRWVSACGDETFRQLFAHPECKGLYGQASCVDNFLVEQGAHPYMDAANKCQTFFYSLFDMVQKILPEQPELSRKTRAIVTEEEEVETPFFTQWLDVDTVVKEYCSLLLCAGPHDNEELFNFYLKGLETLLTEPKGVDYE